jgi:hypothetical protein
MNIPELLRILTFADGSTDPVIPSGIEVVLIQKGKAEVGKLFYTTGALNTYIDHPENNLELSQKALDIIKFKRPELLESGNAVMLTCPEEITNKMIWKA